MASLHVPLRMIFHSLFLHEEELSSFFKKKFLSVYALTFETRKQEIRYEPRNRFTSLNFQGIMNFNNICASHHFFPASSMTSMIMNGFSCIRSIQP